MDEIEGIEGQDEGQESALPASGVLDSGAATDGAAEAAKAEGTDDGTAEGTTGSAAKGAAKGADDNDPLAAIERGIADASKGKPADDAADEDTDDDGTAEVAQQEDAADGKATAEKAKDEKPKAEEPDAELDAEVASLKLKGRTEERFRQLYGEAKQFKALNEALTAANLKPDQVPDLVARAQTAEAWEGMVQRVRTNPDQMGTVFAILEQINSGDPAKMARGVERMQTEMREIAKALGMEAPGYDPLSEHPDLAAGVEDGSISRKHALEVAQARNTRKLAEQRQQAEQTSAQQQAAEQQAKQQAQADLQALETELQRRDPHYAAKWPVFRVIAHQVIHRSGMHPSQWAKALAEAYAQIPQPAAAAPPAKPAAQRKPPVGAMPLRPTGGQRPMSPDFDDPIKAIEFGIELASRGGGV